MLQTDLSRQPLTLLHYLAPIHRDTELRYSERDIGLARGCLGKTLRSTAGT
ncbi:hypothetical protein [Rhodoferax ferrireducens]|uniref:hypothetical protein n=1 Tax=Rhodoferax ferrireducens TaxID=192843 RepID=UPI00140F8D62|nr:hypothetical protein [Rhodoferax ferrireducens]